MRDHDALRAQLFVALALGLGACTDGQSQAEPEPTKADRAADPDSPEPDDAKKTGPGGMGKLVQEIKADADADPTATGDGASLSSEPKVDPVEHCGSPNRTMTVEDADANRFGPGDALGCAISTAPAGVTGMANFTLNESTTQALRDAGDTEHCCYRIRRPRRGRPLLTDGRMLLPGFELGARGSASGLPGPRMLRVTAAWLRDARLEWASVASFERAAEELRRLGAPQGLRRRYDRAADDERRHAAACLRIAQTIGGRRLRLGALPERPPRSGDLITCLRRTFTEGCVAETSAALVATRSARRARPDIAGVLRTIADEEANHAALAWTTVGWGLRRCTVAQRETWLAWAREQRPPAYSPGRDLDAHYGRLSAATERAIAAEAWERCIEPLLEQLEQRSETSIPPRPDPVRRALAT